MSNQSAVTRRWRVISTAVIAALLLCIPVAPAGAAIERNQDVDNTLIEFDNGSFQLSASALYPTGTPAIEGDLQGAVQLAPVAALRTMQNSGDLPFGRRQAGVVAVGRNIFVIGGLGPDATNASDVRQASVYHSQVNLEGGALGAWGAETPLPAVQQLPNNPTPIAERSLVAAAALSTGQDSGYIYVLGGEITLGSNSLSSNSVLRGTVQNGHITAWDSLPNIPDMTGANPNLGPEGVLGASAFIAELPNGRVFLYLIGGLQRYKPISGLVEEYGSRYIWYTEINRSTGGFAGANWNTTYYTIPLDNALGDTAGVWNGSVTGGVYETTDGLAGSAAFYVMGGQILPGSNTASSQIYRADINVSDGTLTMSNPSGAGTSNASLGAARSLHAAVQFQGSVYVMGGVPQGGTATQTVLGSYIQGNNRFPELGGPGSGTYFISTDTLGKPGLPAPRAEHGAVAIPYPAGNPVGAYVYVIGGGAGGNGSAAEKSIFRSEIGNASATDVSYPFEGWFVSDPVQFLLANASLKRIFWYTDQSKGGNIVVQYRVSADNNCATLATKTQAQAPWIDTNPGSQNGVNNFALSPVQANCFQYRVKLTPSNFTSSNATPYLLRLGIVIEVPGATDLTVTQASFSPAGSPQSMSITLRNENVFLPGEPTLPADYGTNGPASAPGSFFVDVFIYPPGVTPPADHTPPTGPSPYAALSIDVLRSEMQAGPNGTGFNLPITIQQNPLNRRYCDYNTFYNSQTCITKAIGEYFSQVGTYKVVVVVDGDNNVKELPNGPNQAESNNVYEFNVDVTEVPKVSYIVNLPVIALP